MISLFTTTTSITTFRLFRNDLPTTDPPLNLTNELIFPDLADGANFNLPQATHLNRYQVRDALSWILGKHTLRLGGEFQHYTAHGEINVFGTGTVILTSDFGFADLNGDGQVNDLDIPIAVALKSSAPVTPVPIPTVFNSYVAGYGQDDWRVQPRLTFNLGLRWEYDSNLTGNSSAHDPCPSLTVAADPTMHLDGERDRSQEVSRQKGLRPARWLCLRSVWQGQDGSSRRLWHLLRPHHS